MATVDYLTMPTDVITTGAESESSDPATDEQLGVAKMHRIRTVRLQQGALCAALLDSRAWISGNCVCRSRNRPMSG